MTAQKRGEKKLRVDPITVKEDSAGRITKKESKGKQNAKHDK